MMLTIHTLFNDPNIVNAVIQRVLKTRKEAQRKFLVGNF